MGLISLRCTERLQEESVVMPAHALQVDRHVGEALEAMRELEKHIGQKKENKAKVVSPAMSHPHVITGLQITNQFLVPVLPSMIGHS